MVLWFWDTDIKQQFHNNFNNNNGIHDNNNLTILCIYGKYSLILEIFN